MATKIVRDEETAAPTGGNGETTDAPTQNLANVTSVVHRHTPMTGQPQVAAASNAHRYECRPPKGNIGVVFTDAQEGGPCVDVILASSVLRGQVKFGDRLVSIDEIDTTAMSAEIAARLLAARGESSTRVLALTRPLSEMTVPATPNTCRSVIKCILALACTALSIIFCLYVVVLVLYHAGLLYSPGGA